MTEVMPYAVKVCVKYPWDKTSDKPEITSIPPDILILAQFESVRGEMEAMKMSMTLNFEHMLKSELDAREIGGLPCAQVHAMMEKNRCNDGKNGQHDGTVQTSVNATIITRRDGRRDGLGSGF